MPLSGADMISWRTAVEVRTRWSGVSSWPYIVVAARATQKNSLRIIPLLVRSSAASMCRKHASGHDDQQFEAGSQPGARSQNIFAPAPNQRPRAPILETACHNPPQLHFNKFGHHSAFGPIYGQTCPGKVTQEEVVALAG